MQRNRPALRTQSSFARLVHHNWDSIYWISRENCIRVWSRLDKRLIALNQWELRHKLKWDIVETAPSDRSHNSAPRSDRKDTRRRILWKSWRTAGSCYHQSNNKWFRKTTRAWIQAQATSEYQIWQRRTACIRRRWGRPGKTQKAAWKTRMRTRTSWRKWEIWRISWT